jgi:hypothetical protein
MIILSCTKAIEDDAVNRQRVVEERTPIFVELEYIESFEVDFVRDIRGVSGKAEGYFTCFNTYGSWVNAQHTFEELKEFIIRDYRIEIPDSINIDLTPNCFIAISIGRELSTLYYFEDRWNHIYDARDPMPIFEKDYHHRTVFIYKGSLPPTEQLACSWWNLHDFNLQFNLYNNIPFDVWVFPPGVVTELEEPIKAYICTQETDLRIYPTRNSPIRARLEKGYFFTIISYTWDGEDINGNSLWYQIRRPEGHGTGGFVHSSFISYFEN